MSNNLSTRVFNCKYGLIILLMFVMTVWASAQTKDEFPNTWVGRWKGNMEIYNGPSLTQTLPMQLHIIPTDSANIFTYRIIYGQDTIAGDRPYLIKIIDSVKGKYIIDEQNSIRIEAYLLGNQLSSCFEVQGNLIFDILEKKGDVLSWRLISGGMKPVSTTGNTKNGDEEIPTVNTYPLRIIQSADLRR